MNKGMFWSLLAVSLFAMPSLAQPKVQASHGDWRVFVAEQGGQRICYIGSLPTKKEGNYSKRGEAYLLVTHKGGNQDEVSVSAGYPFKEQHPVKLHIDQRSFDLFVKGELAWAYDAQTDKDLVKEMMRGASLVVRGESWKGTSSKDTYSLKGFTDAHRNMKQLCP